METKAQVIHFFVDGHKFETEHSTLSVPQIKSIAGVPADYVLFEEEHGHDVRLPNDATVQMKDGLHFESAPDGNVS